MIDGMEIIDAHMHIFTNKFTQRIRKMLDEKDETYRKAFKTWYDGFQKKYNRVLTEDNTDPPEKIAEDWSIELDAHGIDRAFYIAIYPEEDELTDFLGAKKDRFYGFATLDPRAPEAPGLLRRRVKEEGYVGLKLYPPIQYFLPSDRSVYPVYEEARSLHIPVMFHMGITLRYDADLRFANPIELHPVARDFSDINFIIPHFGAGYFQEVLFLGYHINNLYLDTSGTNRWIDYLPFKTDLGEVFKKALDIFGPERIIFGTDSSMLSQGYRKSVLETQMAILKELDLTQEEMTLIMGGNIRRLTHI